MSDIIITITFLLGFIWLMIILFIDYGPKVIYLFITGIGIIILVIIALLDIKRTWKPIIIIIGSLIFALFISQI
jgi:hypothetical protein